MSKDLPADLEILFSECPPGAPSSPESEFAPRELSEEERIGFAQPSTFRYRTVWISDIHLGTPAAKAEPLLKNRYYRYDHKYLWFPHQDYYMNLSLAMPPEEQREPGINYFFLDMQDPEKRRAFLDIVVYRRYEQSLADWEPSNPGKFALYLRKDLVNEIWTYQAGPEQP